MPPPAAGRLWFDVQDLIDYAAVMSRPTGIQRLSLELYRALVLLEPERIGFVRHDQAARTLRLVTWPEIEALWKAAGATPAPDPVIEAPAELAAPQQFEAPRRGPARRLLGRIARRLPDGVHHALVEAARRQLLVAAALRRVAHAMPAIWSSGRAPGDAARPAASDAPNLRDVGRPGDVLASFGSPWSVPGYAETIAGITRGAGMRFGMLVYDLIPLVRPEFYERLNGKLFERYMRSCLPLADHVLAISEATVRDVERWSQQQGVALRTAPRAIPIGTGFSHAGAAADLPQGLQRGGYALLVSTVEARKNHITAFRAWRALLDQMPREQVPTLVFAGRIGWMVSDLMQQIENANHLDGKLVLVQNPDDATLAALYAGARFTVFPSLYEGWGLPVSESLAFGKVCIASSSTSIPEAGQDFCLYHDPDSVTDTAALYRRAIETPELITNLEHRIAAEYRPTPWTDSAQAVISALSGTAPS